MKLIEWLIYLAFYVLGLLAFVGIPVGIVTWVVKTVWQS